MKGILLVSHGKLAEGMKDTLEIFSGEVEQLDSLALESGQDIEEFSKLLRKKIDELDKGQGVVIFCDLAFGTPSNVSGRLLSMDHYKDSVQIITGMNLPMVLEYTQVRRSNTKINDILEVGKEGIIDFNEKISNR